MRAPNNGLGRVEAFQALSQSEPQSEKPPMPVPSSLPRQPAVIDLTTIPGDAQESEPPAKRLKLDVTSGAYAATGSPAPVSGGEARTTPGTATAKPQSLTWRGRPAWSFQALLSETTGAVEFKDDDATAQGKTSSSPPPLPLLPWKYTPQETPATDAPKIAEIAPVTEVKTTTYRIEVPTIAPKIKGESKLTHPAFTDRGDSDSTLQKLRTFPHGQATTQKMFPGSK